MLILRCLSEHCHGSAARSYRNRISNRHAGIYRSLFMTSSHLPPLSSSGVLSISSSSLIDAPLEKVWSIMLDFPSYNKWNSFMRSQTIVDSSKEPLLDQTPREGNFLLISINLPPTMQEPGWFGAGSVFVKIKTIDHANHRAAWSAQGLPNFLLWTERWQSLSIDEATGKTKYETIEVFGGLFAYLIKLLVAKNLALGLEAAADCLKKHAEEPSDGH